MEDSLISRAADAFFSLARAHGFEPERMEDYHAVAHEIVETIAHNALYAAQRLDKADAPVAAVQPPMCQDAGMCPEWARSIGFSRWQDCTRSEAAIIKAAGFLIHEDDATDV